MKIRLSELLCKVLLKEKKILKIDKISHVLKLYTFVFVMATAFAPTFLALWRLHQ